MTNEEIILNNRVFLMEQEVIKGVEGQRLIFTDENGTREIPMPEEIHTFQEWKRLGFQVQKGEHAVAKFPIWKKSGKSKKEGDDDGQEKDGRFFMKVAFFFTKDQVKPIKETE